MLDDIFNFDGDSGKPLLNGENDAEIIREEIEKNLGEDAISGFVVTVEDGKVVLAGVAQSNDIKERAILIAGNIEGVESVDAEQ